MGFRIEGKKKAETPKSVLVEPDNIDLEPMWLPLSQIEEQEWDEDGKGYVIITDWLRKKIGLDPQERDEPKFRR